MKKNENLFKAVMLLVALLFGFSAFAEEMEADVDTQPAITLQQNSEDTSMPWTLQAGESLNDIARLIYPKNKAMQRLFVEKSLYLTRYVQPNLNPAQRADADSTIIIPNIKFLTPAQTHHKTARVKSARTNESNQSGLSTFSISPALQATYDNLLARNAFLKEELEKLNAKLEELIELLASLKDELARLLSQPAYSTTLPTSQETPPSTPFSVEQPTLSAQEKQFSRYLWLPILSVIFVMGLFLALTFFNSKQASNIYLKIMRKYDNIRKGVVAKPRTLKTKKSPTILAYDFPIEPVVKSEYSGGMIVTDLSDIGIPNEIDNGDLALEQANIYLDIDRKEEAIKLLKAQVKSNPKSALPHWLLLLDIYRDTNQKEAFMKYARLLHENFNVMMPEWKVSTLPEAIKTSIEGFTHISNKVIQLWANCESEVEKLAQTKGYLDTLLLDNRNNERTGFSLEVVKEIMLLRNVLEMRGKMALED